VKKEFTHYDLLGVTQDASASELQSAYRSAVKQYHPDINKAHNATQLLGMINEAYDVLKSPDSRRAYDASLLRRWCEYDEEAPVPPEASNAHPPNAPGPPDPPTARAPAQQTTAWPIAVSSTIIVVAVLIVTAVAIGSSIGRKSIDTNVATVPTTQRIVAGSNAAPRSNGVRVRLPPPVIRANQNEASTGSGRHEQISAREEEGAANATAASPAAAPTGKKLRTKRIVAMQRSSEGDASSDSSPKNPTTAPIVVESSASDTPTRTARPSMILLNPQREPTESDKEEVQHATRPVEPSGDVAGGDQPVDSGHGCAEPGRAPHLIWQPDPVISPRAAEAAAPGVAASVTVALSSSGQPLSATRQTSSGDSSLDRAAIQAALGSTFTGATQRCIGAVASTYTLSVTFS
jgi:curved DNA-binding protein CbpA